MRRFRLLWLLIVSLVLLYVAIGAILAHQYRSLSEVMRSGDDNALWAFAQLSTEYQRFDHALHTYMLDPIAPRRNQASDLRGSIGIDELQLRYDIFVSRVSTIQTDSAVRLMGAEPIYQQTLQALEHFIKTGDSSLEAFARRGTPLDAALLREQLQALQDDILAPLSATERAAIDELMTRLNQCLQDPEQSTAATVEAATKALADGTEAFAAQRMNRGIQQALAGRRVQDI